MNYNHKYNISVIVPIFNAESTLNRCIQSILNQSYNNYEILLINDGSTDNSLEICQSYSNNFSNIQTINTENDGVSSARNLGIRMSNSKWICFLDSDDYVDSNYLQELIDNNTNCDLVIAGIKLVDDKENLLNEINFPNKLFSINDKEVFLQQYPITDNGFSVSKLYKRKIIIENAIFFNEKIYMFEDTIFVLTYMKYCKEIKFNSSINYNYVIKKGNTLSTKVNPYENELLTYIKLKKILFSDYNLTYSDLAIKYNATGKRLSHLLDRTIITLYIKKHNKEFRINAMKNYENLDWKIYKKFYKPKNPIKILIKILLYKNNFLTADLLLCKSYAILKR